MYDVLAMLYTADDMNNLSTRNKKGAVDVSTRKHVAAFHKAKAGWFGRSTVTDSLNPPPTPAAASVLPATP